MRSPPRNPLIYAQARLVKQRDRYFDQQIKDG
jgi:hypothetical protein